MGDLCSNRDRMVVRLLPPTGDSNLSKQSHHSPAALVHTGHCSRGDILYPSLPQVDLVF